MTIRQCNEIRDLFLGFVTGELESEKVRRVESHLTECRPCREEFESAEKIWRRLGQFPTQEPPEASARRFNMMLEAFQAGHDQGCKERSRFRFSMPALMPLGLQTAVLALILVAIGYFLGRQPGGQTSSQLAALQTEVHNMRELVVLSMLQNDSTAERLKAISWSSRVPDPDARVISALVDSLKYDPNVNVRLAAIDVLSNFGTNSSVREDLIESLSEQESPMVQIGLIETLVSLKARESRAAIQQLINNPKVHREVRSKAEWGVAALNL